MSKRFNKASSSVRRDWQQDGPARGGRAAVERKGRSRSDTRALTELAYDDQREQDATRWAPVWEAEDEMLSFDITVDYRKE